MPALKAQWTQRDTEIYTGYASDEIRAAIEGQLDAFEGCEPCIQANEATEIEHHSRPGFISANDGGWEIKSFTDLPHIEGSGCRLPRGAHKIARELLDNKHAQISNEIRERYSDKFGETKDEISWREAMEAGLEAEYQEIEAEYYEDDTVMLNIGAFYRESGGAGGHTCYVWACINFEAPYHRNIDRWEWSQDSEFTFSDREELQAGLTAALKEVTKEI